MYDDFILACLLLAAGMLYIFVKNRRNDDDDRPTKGKRFKIVGAAF